jgi:DNA-binding transcriptional regulator YdaS (Cro superfamily)
MFGAMKLNDYLKQARGLTSWLAQKLDVSPVTVSNWASGKRSIPAERCLQIERNTGGAVTCEELLPDVDWAVLRGSSPVQPVQTDAADPDASRIVPVETA